ncbi:MAG: tryptophan 7-halogenase [Planctomycetaceae bacterium]|nr:tryptophan 7-halogenase [Planctomycetaceae bacterium]
MSIEFDAVILGGGPAGSTVATLLAQAGKRVVVLEKEHFPRYHIGESLLPATVSIFERLGVHDAIRKTSVLKPGGKWLYGSHEVPGDFTRYDDQASFQRTPYSYLVDREVFDKILLDRSAECGADVRYGHEVVDLIQETGRVTGVVAVDDVGNRAEYRGRLVIDATGLGAVIGRRLKLRQPTVNQRMGIYAQYRAEPIHRDAIDGWFVGQMFYDGWTWLINLPDDTISVGVVLPVERFRKISSSPEELLDRMVRENDLLKNGMTPNPMRMSEVRVTGNMGNSSKQLAGEGWVMVGDAGFFIDPCYSSGVHVAMESATLVADLILQQPDGVVIPATAFRQYESKLRNHEKYVTRMVEAFYMASRNTTLQKVIVTMQDSFLKSMRRKFVTFVGGDFSKNSAYITRVFLYSKFISWLFPNNTTLPENRPDYLVDPVVPFVPPANIEDREIRKAA